MPALGPWGGDPALSAYSSPVEGVTGDKATVPAGGPCTGARSDCPQCRLAPPSEGRGEVLLLPAPRGCPSRSPLFRRRGAGGWPGGLCWPTPQASCDILVGVQLRPWPLLWEQRTQPLRASGSRSAGGGFMGPRVKGQVQTPEGSRGSTVSLPWSPFPQSVWGDGPSGQRCCYKVPDPFPSPHSAWE